MEAEDIDVHALVLQPCLFVSDVDENARVYYEACEEHYHEHRAYTDRRLGAAVRIHVYRIVKKTHGCVYFIHLVP